MGRFEIPDHPEIACIERTGYPSWMQEDVLPGLVAALILHIAVNAFILRSTGFLYGGGISVFPTA